MQYISMYPLGDSAIVVQLGIGIEAETHRKVQVLSSYLDKHPLPGMLEYVPSFTSVTIFYDIMAFYSSTWQATGDEAQEKSPYATVQSLLEDILVNLSSTEHYESKIVEIPVLYGGEYGPDLKVVAEHNGLTPEEVVKIHSEGEYLTYMIGFAPGFPYLGGLSERIAAPRRETPRLKIPAGTVGIAGKQTGVYPIETPGGWQLIGRTPVSLFRPGEWPPTLLQAGNIVRFKPITLEEYEQWIEVMT